jgi:hypothetical protein
VAESDIGRERALERALEGLEWVGELCAALRAELAGEPGEHRWWPEGPPDLAAAVTVSVAVARAAAVLAPLAARAVADELRQRWGTGGP